MFHHTVEAGYCYLPLKSVFFPLPIKELAWLNSHSRISPLWCAVVSVSAKFFQTSVAAFHWAIWSLPHTCIIQGLFRVWAEFICTFWSSSLCSHFYDMFFLSATAKSLQSCPTLCDPRDGSPPGFPVPGILQARTLEWVAISFSNEWKWKVKVKSLSRSRLLVTPWTAAYQAPLSMDFPGKSTGVGCHCLLRFSL